MPINHSKRVNYRNSGRHIELLNAAEVIEAYLRRGNLRAAAEQTRWHFQTDPDAGEQQGMNPQTLFYKLCALGVDLVGHPTVDLLVHEDGQVVPYQLSRKARANVAERHAKYARSQSAAPPDYTLLTEVLARCEAAHA